MLLALAASEARVGVCWSQDSQRCRFVSGSSGREASCRRTSRSNIRLSAGTTVFWRASWWSLLVWKLGTLSLQPRYVQPANYSTRGPLPSPGKLVLPYHPSKWPKYIHFNVKVWTFYTGESGDVLVPPLLWNCLTKWHFLFPVIVSPLFRR